TLAAREIISKEVQSKASLIFRMTVRPAFTFLKMFFLKQGIRDGIYGFILAVLYSFYTFLKYLKAWEMRL
ncbi:MAG: glycosyltransferase family 2 protein, partial [Thermodesulfovibrionales bacterium]